MTTPPLLQFDSAATPPAITCAACKGTVGDAYYTVGKSLFCGACKRTTEQKAPSRPTAAVLARSALFGLGGAIAGALVYYAVIAATGAMIGFVAIAVGFLVGRGVQLGAREQRGRPFQIIAVVLTYLGIAAGYAPLVLKEAHGAYAGLIVLVYPILRVATGFPQSILTAIIIAVGLRQAWQMNHAPPRPVFEGPFRVAGDAKAATPAPAAPPSPA
jgi:hypothetical protein